MTGEEGDVGYQLCAFSAALLLASISLLRRRRATADCNVRQ